MITDNFDFRKDKFYRDSQEFREVYQYVMENKNPESYVYITPLARPAAQYYTDYIDRNQFQIKNIVEADHYIWGFPFRRVQCEIPYVYRFTFDNDEMMQNIKAITKHNDVYIIDAHEHKHHQMLVDGMKELGMNVDSVYSFHKTFVYHYTK